MFPLWVRRAYSRVPNKRPVWKFLSKTFSHMMTKGENLFTEYRIRGPDKIMNILMCSIFMFTVEKITKSELSGWQIFQKSISVPGRFLGTPE